MVNIHISSECKEKFKSKNAITRLKTFIKENGDTGLVTSSEYLKEGCSFEFKEEGENIHVDVKEKEYVWGNRNKNNNISLNNKNQPSSDPKQKIREKLRELRDIRSGKHHREMRTMKKTVDRDVLEKYVKLYRTGLNVPVPKPNELLDDPDKYKQQIEMFGSGLIGITKNQQVDAMIADYFRTVAEKVGFEVMSMEKLKEMMPQQQQPQQPAVQMPSSIDLSKYVDSDTESDSDEDSDEKSEDGDEKTVEAEKDEKAEDGNEVVQKDVVV